MRTLRNLVVLLLFVLAALWLDSGATQATPQSPRSDCIWVYGTSSYEGVWSCPECNYFYTYDPDKGDWDQTGDDCDLEMNE